MPLGDKEKPLAELYFRTYLNGKKKDYLNKPRIFEQKECDNIMIFLLELYDEDPMLTYRLYNCLPKYL
jgi:hypothetical protein